MLAKMANRGSVVQVDVDALSGAVSNAITQAIRQHSNAAVSTSTSGTAAVTSITLGAGQAQSTSTRTSTTHDEEGLASTSGRKRRVPFALPSSFLKRGKAESGASARKKKFQEWDRDVMCIPLEYARGNEVVIPRGKARAKLASMGLTGKIRLHSDMSEEAIFAEIRSVFSAAMRNDQSFPFEILQSAGGGSKTLVIPCRSTSFVWTAKQVIASAGRGYIYILAKEEICVVKEEEQPPSVNLVDSESDDDLPEISLNTTPSAQGSVAASSSTADSTATTAYRAYCSLGLIDLTDAQSECDDNIELQEAIANSLTETSTHLEDMSSDMLTHALQLHANRVLNRELEVCQRINVRRSDVFNDGVRAFGRSSFDASKCLKVRFIGEPAVDQGGPRREFFRLFLSEMGQISGMFQGWPDRLSPVPNSQAVANKMFSTCGKVLASMIVQGGQAPCCFSAPIADFIVYGEVHCSQEKLRKVNEATSSDELEHVIGCSDYSFRFDCGFSRVITMQNKQEFLSVAWKHFVLYSIYAELTEFRNGMLNTLNLKHLASVSPRVLHYLLAAENAKPLTAEFLQDLFVPEFSDHGSNDRTTEETIIHNWFTFIEEVSDSLVPDVTLEDILIFITGASAVPPLGFEPSPTIRFVEEQCLPFASSCANVLYFPRTLALYNHFKERMSFALCGSHGFGSV